jgi:hypothetical protein
MRQEGQCMLGSQAECHGLDFALTPPPVNSGHVQHLAPISRTSSIFQHHSDPIPATPVAEITASPSSRIRLPLLPSHPLVSFTVPLSRFHLHIPFTTHPSLCHMLRLLFPLVIITGLPGLTGLLVSP